MNHRIESSRLTLVISGSGKLYIKETQADEIESKISGSGFVSLGEMTNKNASYIISGSGETEVFGSSQETMVRISGSGSFLGESLTTGEARISILGSGDVKIRVEQKLSARITGSGTVRYYGSPHLELLEQTGSGKIIHYDDQGAPQSNMR